MKLSLHDKSVLYHELAKLTASGFGFDKSADLLLQQAPNRTTAAFAREAIHRLQAGQSIAASVHQPDLGLCDLDYCVIQAAERGGVLETGLAFLRDHYQSNLRNHRALRARLFYPALLLHLAVFLPAIPPLLLGRSASTQLGGSLALLLAVYLAIGLSGFAWILLHRSASRSLVADRLLYHLPLLGKARRLACLRRFTAVFRISLLAALRTSEAVDAAGGACGSAILNQAARKLAKTAEQGKALASILPEVHDFPPDFRRSLTTAELSGTLEQDLQSWTLNFTHEFDTHMIRVGTFLPSAATLLVGIFVAWRLMSLYFGIVNSQMKALENLW